jgi:hypothetical protein
LRGIRFRGRYRGKADMAYCGANVCFDPERTLQARPDTLPRPDPQGRQ